MTEVTIRVKDLFEARYYVEYPGDMLMKDVIDDLFSKSTLEYDEPIHFIPYLRSDHPLNIEGKTLKNLLENNGVEDEDYITAIYKENKIIKINRVISCIITLDDKLNKYYYIPEFNMSSDYEQFKHTILQFIEKRERCFNNVLDVTETLYDVMKKKNLKADYIFRVY